MDNPSYLSRPPSSELANARKAFCSGDTRREVMIGCCHQRNSCHEPMCPSMDVHCPALNISKTMIFPRKEDQKDIFRPDRIIWRQILFKVSKRGQKTKAGRPEWARVIGRVLALTGSRPIWTKKK